MYPILACSIAMVAVAADRYWVIGRCKKNESHLMLLNRCALESRGAAKNLLEERLSRSGSKFLKKLTSGIDLLELVGRLAPMLGLLGTVLGLTVAFKSVADSPIGADPVRLSSGIWEALITTVAGMFVSIPSIALHHMLLRRLDLIRFEMKLRAEELLSDQAPTT